ncbi:MAG: hypothetical protein HY001_02815, partial [Candidatus Portnoybacteria bacterium]|nr:hypothetical protein [Candidatus Portnoybacteria bacterium]
MKQDEVTTKAKLLYEEISFGDFSYGSKRLKYDRALIALLQRVKNREVKVYDIGC